MESIVIKIGDSFQKHHFSVSTGSGASLTIGRAFNNDVIITDPYIGPSQLTLSVSEDDQFDWQAQITDTTNPVFNNHDIIEKDSFGICSGDEITLGRTNICLFAEDHDVAVTREFSFTNWLHSHKFKPLIASAMFMVLLGFTLFMSYLELSTELVWSDMSLVVMIVAILTIIWVSGWALAGYLLKGNHHFFSHLFFTSFTFILLILTGDIASYVDYAFNSRLAGEMTDWSFAILLTGLLLGFNLTLVTYNPGTFRKGMIASVCLWGVIIFYNNLYSDDYSYQPVHSVSVKPSWISLSKAVSVDTYIDDYDDLFVKLAATDKR